MKPSKFENTFLKALLLCFSLVITPVVWAVSAMETYYRYSPEGLEDKEPYQISPQNPEPVTEGNPDWKLYKFPRTVCLNNTQSTLAVNDFGKERQEQENLVVFFQGGNACFDPVSCSAAHWKNGYDWEHFIYQKDGSEKSDLNLNHEGQGAYDRGIFSTDASKSPYHGHSQVVVPYCSGDAYMGSAAPDQPTYIPGDGKTHGFETGRIVIYRGFYNVKEYIRWLAEQYPSAKNIVLIGQSAGSIGAMYHYKRFFDAFNSNSDPNQPLVEVSLVDDSGFMLQDGDVNYCARRAVQYFWNIDDGLRETLNLPEDEPVDVTASLMDSIRQQIYKTPKAKVAHIRSGQDIPAITFYKMIVDAYKEATGHSCDAPYTFPNSRYGLKYATAIQRFIQQANDLPYYSYDWNEHTYYETAKVRTWFLKDNWSHQWLMGATGLYQPPEPWKIGMHYRDNGTTVYTLADWLDSMQKYGTYQNDNLWDNFELNTWNCFFDADYKDSGPFAHLCKNRI